jgi:predicted dehydrogenase
VRADIAGGGYARLYHAEESRRIAVEPMNVFARATVRLMEEFIHALDTGGTPPCNAEDNRRTLALMLAAYESEENRRPIVLSEFFR